MDIELDIPEVSDDFSDRLVNWDAKAKATVESINGIKQSMEGVMNAPEPTIFDPVEEDRIRGIREEFTAFENVFANMGDNADYFSDRMSVTTDETKKSGQAMMGLANSIGMMFEQAVLHGDKLGDVVKNLLKQLASRAFITGIGALLTGGTSLGGGSFLSAMFGGLFHSGGVVGGSGDKMIRAKGGEMVLTKSQQKALSMGGGGQSSPSINPNAMSMAFERALDRKLSKLGADEIYALSQRGRVNY